MSLIERLTVFLGAFLTALLITYAIHKVALRLSLIDKPSPRSSHSEPTPRGGGLAIVVAFFLALPILYLRGAIGGQLASALICTGGAIAVVGFIDDRGSLPANIRFLVHVGAAIAAVTLIGVPNDVFCGVFARQHWVIFILSVLALIWATNLFNFMDGVDGIAGVEAVFFASAAAAINSYLGGNPGLTTAMFSLASGSFGFLIWNWPPARIFMGDVGSGFLGFTLAACVLAMSRVRHVAIEVSLILGAIFVVDASVTLLRRIVRKDRWFEAHRTHAYQHLARRWRSHRRITMVVSAINVGWLLPWAFAAATYPNYAILFVGLAFSPLIVLALVVGAGAP